MKSGSMPTERKALTGEFTPPGMTALARSKYSLLRDVFIYGLPLRIWKLFPN
jgi:hypothetical protein